MENTVTLGTPVNFYQEARRIFYRMELYGIAYINKSVRDSIYVLKYRNKKQTQQFRTVYISPNLYLIARIK